MGSFLEFQQPEQEQYMQYRDNWPRNDPFSNAYNEGWTCHPNFAWREPRETMGQQQQQHYDNHSNSSNFFSPNNVYRPPGYNQRRQEEGGEKQSGLEDMMMKFMSKMDFAMDRVKAVTDQHTASIRILAGQMGQLAETLANQNQGTFPSLPEKGPQEECHAIHLRNGEKVIKKEDVVEKKDSTSGTMVVDQEEPNEEEEQEVTTVALTKECSAIIQDRIPPKLQDPGSFVIPVQIENSKFDKVLCDLGSSINLISLTMCRKLGLGEIKPTNMTLQMADKSIKYPHGIVEDILVKTGKFHFPVDFVVLESDVEVPLILGRPFLATSKALIDMEEGEMTLKVGAEKVKFKMRWSIRGKVEWEPGDRRKPEDEKESAKVHKSGGFNSADTEPN